MTDEELEKLSDVLAEVTGTTAEAIKQGTAELEIAPFEEATVVDDQPG